MLEMKIKVRINERRKTVKRSSSSSDCRFRFGWIANLGSFDARLNRGSDGVERFDILCLQYEFADYSTFVLMVETKIPHLTSPVILETIFMREKERKTLSPFIVI